MEDVLPRKNGLDYQIIDSGKQLAGLFLAYIEAKEVLECTETPFTSEVLLILLLTLHKLCILLIDAVIGQVLKLLILAIIGILVVGLSRKPAQSLVVDVDPEGVDAEDGDVDPEVKFEVVDEERVADVVADYQGGIFL